MSLLFLMKMLGEFSFYFIFGNYLLTQTGWQPIPLFFCLVPAFGVWLCYLLHQGEKRLWRLPLALVLLPLFWLRGELVWGVYLFGSLYGALLVLRRVFHLAHDGAVENFQRCSLLLGLALPALSLVSGGTAALTRAVPLALLFLGASLLQTRMLRHDAKTLAQRPFLLQNLGALLAVGALAFAASRPGFLAALNGVGSFLYQRIILPLLEGVLYLILGIVWLFGKLYSLFRPDFDPILPKQAAQEINLAVPGLEYDVVTRTPQWVQNLFIALLLLGLMALAGYILYKLTTRHSQDTRRANFYDERQTLERKPPARTFPALAPRDPRRAVRHYYYKFLQEARRQGVAITENSTTLDISHRAASVYQATALEQLRQYYLLARYSPAPVSRAQARLAKEAYRALLQSNKQKQEDKS